MTTARSIPNAWVDRTLPAIFYEEPMGRGASEDGMQQELPIDDIQGALRERYRGRDDVFISNLVFISYDRSDGNARLQPDLFIAFGVDAAAIRENLPNFWIWEIGKAPDFVMEVASPSTAANDMGRKRGLYRQMGVTEYWRFDPTGGDLYGRPMIGEYLVGGEYIPYEITVAPDGSRRAHSRLLDLDFAWNGADFDVLDPGTGKSIRVAELLVAEQDARQAAEAEIARLRRQLRRYEAG